MKFSACFVEDCSGLVFLSDPYDWHSSSGRGVLQRSGCMLDIQFCSVELHGCRRCCLDHAMQNPLNLASRSYGL